MSGNRNFGTYRVAGIPVSAIPKPSYGNVFFVGNAVIAGQDVAVDDPGYGNHPSRPFATITYALSKAVASRGDTIYVMPGHTEAITAASGIDVNKIGVTIEGLGTGSFRPNLSIGAAAGTIAMSAANTTMRNIIATANYADVATAFVTSADYVTLDHINFPEAGANLNYFSCVSTDAVANSSDYLTVSNCTRYAIDTAALATVSILEAQEGVTITGNKDVQTYGADVGHHVILGAFDVTNFECSHNVLHMVGDNSGQSVGNLITGSSTASDGIVHHNLVGGVDVGGLLDTATLEFSHYENYFVGIAAKSGLILPAIA